MDKLEHFIHWQLEHKIIDLYSYFKTVHQLLKKLNRNSAPQAAISGSLPMEMKTCPQKDMYIHIYQQTGGRRRGGREVGPEEMGANENS